jgi:hypothetical protein
VRCAIVQPSYIPWRGYFDLIRRVDLFVFYDDVQYDRRGWRNRNRIKTAQGTRWLTIPVHARGSQVENIAINAIATAGDEWSRQHYDALLLHYRHAPHFQELSGWLRRLYDAPPPLLADFTIRTTMDIAAMLGINATRFVRSSEFDVRGTKTERLLAVLRRAGATTYLSGPSARSYLDVAMLEDAGITVEWMTYEYPEYPQLHPPFDPHVSVLDLLFMTGSAAPRFIWTVD